MSLDAFLFISHEDGAPHCELRHVPETGALAVQEVAELEYLEHQLLEAGEETEPMIGTTAVRLDVEQLEVLQEVGLFCDVYTIADPSELGVDSIEDHFISGTSLI